ncbi:MAG TPA: flagellar motor protein MotB, partial [Syntrophomonadaceae bacterium]|nr:flagellar motor protein MotB [Syntrophomonadaceae bacterium]
MSSSRRNKKHEAEKENQERWLVTYADLITLLMIFFVLMYTMSQVDARKYAAVA